MKDEQKTTIYTTSGGILVDGATRSEAEELSKFAGRIVFWGDEKIGNELSPAIALGKLGGKVTSDAKAKAAVANGRKGGRKARVDISTMLSVVDRLGKIRNSKYFRTYYPSEWRKACRLKAVILSRDEFGNKVISVNRGKSVVNFPEKARLA